MTDKKRLSRRRFLTAAGAGLAGIAMPYFFIRRSAGAADPAAQPLPAGSGLSDLEMGFIQPRPAQLNMWGRITGWTPVREAPEGGATLTDQLAVETVIPLLEKVEGQPTGANPNNPLWYRIRNGYIYTATVQLMKPYRQPEEISKVITTIEEEPGCWAEVIVPRTQARNKAGGAPHTTEVPDGEETRETNVYLTYGSVVQVIDVQPDDAGYLWYKIDDDKPQAKSYYILARHLRIIPEEDLSPINPGVPKRIEVSLIDQRMDFYENDLPVRSILVSSGAAGFDTPRGNHAVVYKQQSRHMYSDPEQEAFSDPDFFDLPGVPFNIFFTTMGHAIHGTYWHGDYGRPRSHGCLNVTPEDARWIFRWVDPFSPYETAASGSSTEPGTPVIVV